MMVLGGAARSALVLLFTIFSCSLLAFSIPTEHAIAARMLQSSLVTPRPFPDDLHAAFYESVRSNFMEQGDDGIAGAMRVLFAGFAAPRAPDETASIWRKCPFNEWLDYSVLYRNDRGNAVYDIQLSGIYVTNHQWQRNSPNNVFHGGNHYKSYSWLQVQNPPIRIDQIPQILQQWPGRTKVTFFTLPIVRIVSPITLPRNSPPQLFYLVDIDQRNPLVGLLIGMNDGHVYTDAIPERAFPRLPST